MPKPSVQSTVAVERHPPNSGIAPVPKPDAIGNPERWAAPLFQFFDSASARDSRISLQTFHGRGSLLFTEGQPASGVFVLEKGLAKLTVCSGRGKPLILGFFGPQSVLGLAATILGRPHESNAETIATVTARFISREDLFRQMRSGDAGFRIAQLLSRLLYSTVREIESLWLTDSVEQSLARFLLSLCPPRTGARAPMYLPLHLTHEDIAQRIGVSRESVTRLLSRFKKRRILDFKQSVLTVLAPAPLERLADFPGDLSSLRARLRSPQRAAANRGHGFRIASHP